MEQLSQLFHAFLNNVTPITDDAPQTLNLFVFFVQWAAIILSALAGLYAARKQGMDIYGALVLGFVVSLGGGTLRDILLGRYPVYWVSDPVYVSTVLVIVILVGLVSQVPSIKQSIIGKAAQPVEKIVQDDSPTFMTIDALALGLWAYLGTLFALEMGTSSIIGVVMGVITASFGGVLRDVLSARVPQTFLPSQLYASAAGAGSIAFVLLRQMGAGQTTSFLACLMVTFLIRILSVKFNIRSR